MVKFKAEKSRLSRAKNNGELIEGSPRIMKYKILLERHFHPLKSRCFGGYCFLLQGLKMKHFLYISFFDFLKPCRRRKYPPKRRFLSEWKWHSNKFIFHRTWTAFHQIEILPVRFSRSLEENLVLLILKNNVLKYCFEYHKRSFGRN